jgi:hypothetical protein
MLVAVYVCGTLLTSEEYIGLSPALTGLISSSHLFCVSMIGGSWFIL